MAAENDCDALLRALAETGEAPAIVINPADETVKIATSRGVCSESIEAWSKREPLPAGKSPAGKPARKQDPPTAPKAAPTTVVVKPVPVEKPAPAPAPVPKPAVSPPIPAPVPKLTTAPGFKSSPPQPVSKPASPTGACDYRLKEVWDSQVIEIEGIKHWLSRAFTLDLDDDHLADNVSFTFIAKGGGKRTIHYYGAAGELSGWSYPALKLPDETVIKRICFDDATYEKPKFFEDAPLKPKWIEVDKPDLAGQMDAREKGIVYKPKAKRKKAKKPEEDSLPWWVWALIGAGVLAGAGGLWAVLRKKAGDEEKDGEDEDADDDEFGGKKDKRGFDDEDDEDEEGGKKAKKSKFNLGGLFKRSKKKKKKGDDEDEDGDDRGRDDDDEEDDAKKKKKSKFSLGGLFKRSKKKKKAADEDEGEKDEGKKPR